MLLLFWLLGTLVSTGVFGYLKGHADARFDKNLGQTNYPPFVLGMITSPLWPVQAVLGLVFAVCFFSIRAGREEGFAINEELHELRKLSSDLQREEAEVWKTLMEKKVDPKAIDDGTKRELLGRSIAWRMEEDAARVREERGLPALPSRSEEGKPSHSTPDHEFAKIMHKHGYYEFEHNCTDKGPLDL